MADVSQFLFEFHVQHVQQRLAENVDRHAIRQPGLVEVFAEQSNRVVKFVHVVALEVVGVLEVLLQNADHRVPQDFAVDAERVQLPGGDDGDEAEDEFLVFQGASVEHVEDFTEIA